MLKNNNTKKVEVQGVKPKKIQKDKIVKMIIQGDKYVDVISTKKEAKATVKKISKEKYMVLSTGEIKDYKEKGTEGKEKTNLRKTFNKLRQLIRTNFTNGGKNQLFITLTYKENMQDKERLMKDFDRFFKRLKRRLKEHKLDYIAVMEPQGRGAWHVHLMLKSDKLNLYIDNKEMAELWGLGYTDTKRLKSDDVGSYYVAYFTDILNEDNKGKKREKGARINLYPKGFKFYRTSRGIKKPEEVKRKYEELEKEGYTKTYETAFEIVDVEKGNVLNVIQKEVWKRKNKKGKSKGLTQKKKGEYDRLTH